MESLRIAAINNWTVGADTMTAYKTVEKERRKKGEPKSLALAAQ